MTDPKQGPFDDHAFAIACLSHDEAPNGRIELDVVSVEGWERARRLINDMVPGIVLPEWWQCHNDDVKRPLRHDVFRAKARGTVSYLVVVARVRGAQDVTDWLPRLVDSKIEEGASPADEDAASLRNLAYTIAYGGRLDNAFRGTTRVTLVAKTIHELRGAIIERDRQIKTLQAEVKRHEEGEAASPCSMAARIDLGHGRDGYCAIMNKACPRACLLKQVNQYKTAYESEEMTSRRLAKGLEENEALVAGLTSETDAQAKLQKLGQGSVKAYIADLMQKSTTSDGEYEMDDDDLKEAYGIAMQQADGVRAFVSWVLGEEKSEETTDGENE